MKANRLIVTGVALSVLMSAGALALQVKKTAGFFDRYLKPFQASPMLEIEFRKLRADFLVLRDYVPMQNGIGPGQSWKLSDNHDVITFQVPVRTSLLPKDFEERKKELENAAASVHAGIIQAFGNNGVSPGLKWFVQNENFAVEFFDSNKWQQAAKGKSYEELDKAGLDPGIIAEYRNGKLTMR